MEELSVCPAPGPNTTDGEALGSLFAWVTVLLQGAVPEWWTKADLSRKKSRMDNTPPLHPHVAAPLSGGSLEPGEGDSPSGPLVSPPPGKSTKSGFPRLVDCPNCKVIAHNSTTSCLQGSWQWYFCENNPACVLSRAMAVGQGHFV